jgi:hypothetical protein
MQTQVLQRNTTVWRSEQRPEVVTSESNLAKVIAWADENPHVWDIVTHVRSKAFGRGSCDYIGWAQRSMAPEAVLERARHFHGLVTGSDPHLGPSHIMAWRARFTFRRYRDSGFTGGFFQQHDATYPRLCLTMDYTPETLDEVVGRFLRWCGDMFPTARVTVDGVTVRDFGGDPGFTASF